MSIVPRSVLAALSAALVLGAFSVGAEPVPQTPEALGGRLFYSQQFTNCAECHKLAETEMDRAETFANYSYHNMGTPENRALREMNGVLFGTVDRGLWDNPGVDDPAQRGKFRTPTRRNVAVTGPYMHNGVFQDLRTVALFYNTQADARKINPETAEPFGPAPVPGTISLVQLEIGSALDDQRIDALVAFLETLTDARYVHLLEDN